jgi:hypothetical protein
VLKEKLNRIFSEANDEEVEEWLSGYKATKKDIIALLRTLIHPSF